MNLLALQLNNGTGIDADGTEKQVCKQFKTDDPGSSLVENERGAHFEPVAKRLY